MAGVENGWANKKKYPYVHTYVYINRVFILFVYSLYIYIYIFLSMYVERCVLYIYIRPQCIKTIYHTEPS